ncbi:Kinase protein with adenine nucleotide alpha hydrolases-like domain, putative isoform 1 [Hibiscus syriacus]|uniref:Kinase protein with adenine nucleotide alpha hydrolases-like domain, putative isoform 1 n=1 Tax=Hibiscus syriacus TaxID=106335 RepID=A0A6A2Z8C8_HIBSY|nr:Kinase protein with adenine nucleotide alpha hydrolases-like domain, putative isoform 1 [Hibiscus syriacus]
MVMSMHIARLVRMPNPSLFLALAVFLSSSLMVVHSAGEPEEIEPLLTFRDSFTDPSALSNWNASINPCTGEAANWVGVLCSVNGKVLGLQLENMGLSGVVNIESLDPLENLRTLSLMNNNFEGKIPEMKKLNRLQALFLSNNHFSGEIPDDTFEGMKSLRKVFLANNLFSGKIPSSLTKMPKLAILKLEGNEFSGPVPEFTGNELKMVNLANNQLEGNKNLCGAPLKECASLSPPPPGSPPTIPPTPLPPIIKKSSTGLKIALIVVSAALVLVILLLIFFLLRRRREYKTSDEEVFVVESYKPPPSPSVQMEKKAPHPTPASNVRRTELIFLKDDVQRFDLQDLLKASAEILGSGNFGASYKAMIGKGEVVVVKNYKQMNSVGKEEFNEHMRRLGRLNHQNLHPLLAYYYRKEEKLLVTSFMVDGSMASHLHANRSRDNPGLDWPTRLNIIKGVIKGLNYLYNQLPTIVVPHGHLKSSNVLLDKNFEPLLCDYALRSLINQDQAHKMMTAYKSPEYAKTGRISRKTDVWCLGIHPGDLNRIRISDVFDKEMKGAKNCKDEMINVLNIGLSCCNEDSEARPELKEVMKEIEGLKGGDDDDDSSSTIGEVNMSISRGHEHSKMKGDPSSFDR